MADRDIPEEMVEKAVARIAHEVYEAWRVTANRDAYVGDAIRAAAGQAVDAVLAGRAVVDLPEPDGTSYEGDPIWSASWGPEDTIFACVDHGRPVVEAPISDGPLTADGAELFGLRLIAAARAARSRAAADSAAGDVGGGL